jgi:oligosaccharide repeat unit polymerase
MNATTHRVRPLAELPFYCDPVCLFIASWALMLGALEIRVSETTYSDRSLGIILFVVSLLAMLMGVGAIRLSSYAEKTSAVSLAYQIDARLLRKINWILCSIVVVIVVFNWVLAGPPPILGFFGAEASVYAEYGRFKQVLFPVAMALSLNSTLEESAFRRWFWRCFSLGTLMAYVARGPILIAVVQALIVYSIRTSVSKRKIYVRACVAIAIALVAMDIVGENRTARESFYQVLEIREDFRTWPMAIVWPISYLSIPISNLCWIVKGAHFDAPTVSFLYPVLPSFWTPASPHEAAVSDSHIIDGTHTYLVNYFLDFSWAGIVGCNFLIGLLGGFLTHRERVSRKFMMSPIILSAFSFIFFWDFFVSLPTIIELCVQGLTQRLCITPIGMRERPERLG